MSTIAFRDFEERDIDFVFKCKNDEKLNSMTVGPYHPFTFEEAASWVHGCMGEHETYKFWAICTNDEEKKIIGWVSLSNIDKDNNSAFFHGIVVADENYRDGRAWIESYLFIYDYVFMKLKLNRLSGSCLTANKASLFITEAMLEKVEGIARQAVYKKGKYLDVLYGAILRDDYIRYLSDNEFEIKKILSRLLEARKTMKKKYDI